MIILERPYSNALLRQAVKDKYATHYFDRSPYKDPHLRPILSSGLNLQLREEVLWYLLLFSPVYLPPLFDNLHVDKLVEEGLIQKSPSLLGNQVETSRFLRKQPDQYMR